MTAATETAAAKVPGAAPTPIWQPAGAECVLCGARRRDYLFVVGMSRMTRCHDCGLISRAGSPAAASPSFELDKDGAAAILAQLPQGRVLQIFHRRGGLPATDRQELVTVDLEQGAKALESVEPGSFDAAFVNASIEQVPDPVLLLRRVRSALRRDGVLLLVAGAGDVDSLRGDKLPSHSFTPATLLRLAQTAGFRTEACGLMERSIGTDAVDERLARPVHLPRLSRLFRALGRPVQVSSGLLELRATAADARPRPKLSVIMPVFNEAKTFMETFQRVHRAAIEGIDQELIIVESNSTDGSRELVRSVETLPGVRVLYEEQPSGKGHAVRAGMAMADGDILLIQDADSEYDVADYDIVLEPLLRLTTTFVLGSRHMGGRTWKIRQFANAKLLAAVMNLAHQFLTALVNWLYQVDTRDPTTMYKVFRRESVQDIKFRRDRFDFDFELVCKLIRRGHFPVEVPINYHSRSYAEGKKVRFFRDPLTWLPAIISSRFEPLFKR
jgi:hypothetical protein